MAIATGTALLASGILGTGAILSSASTARKAATKATQQQTGAINEAIGVTQEGYNEARQFLEEYYGKAIGTQEDLAGLTRYVSNYADLLNNPAKILERSPALQYQYQQGLGALRSTLSTVAGGGGSGQLIKAAEEYGQNFAATMLDQELSRLTTLINYGVQAKGNIANLYGGLGTNVANLYTGEMSDVKDLILNRGATTAEGTVAKSNIFTNTAANIANQFGSLASLYSIKPELFTKQPAQPTIPTPVTI